MSEHGPSDVRVEWLRVSHQLANINRQELNRAASICHEVPVAVTRLAHNRHVLSHRDDAPTTNRVTPKPKPNVSIIEIAHELTRMLRSGEASSQADLARKFHLTRPRVTQLLNLIELAKPIQDFLRKTKDNNGRIRERHLRPLVQFPKTEQIKAFRALLRRNA